MLLNRDELIATVFRETDRAQRMMTPLALILCGINGTEDWSLRLPQSTIDEVMGELPVRLLRHLRCYDSIGRYRAGEFVLVLPGCNGFNAVAMAQRLRAEAFGSSIRTGTGELHLTGSFGVAGTGGRSPLVVLRNAEQALKIAKARGPGVIERCTYDTEPDSATFSSPVIRSEVTHW